MTGQARGRGFDDWIGQVLGERYRLVRRLGVGGMGTVYEARHVLLDRRFAIKVLRPDMNADERQRRRFLREAQATNRITSDNVVQILDVGSQPVAYFVMEYLEGRDLQAVLRSNGPFDWPTLSPIVLQVIRGLTSAHAVGIVHRDVKPSNIFLQRVQDGTHVAKVLDFGIAKVIEPHDPRFTRTAEIIGTVAYMAPEQVRTLPIDARTDVYSLGIVIYELLSGRLPFRAASSFDLLEKHVHAPPIPLCEVAPDVPREVEAIVLRALEKRPEDRFQSMEELGAAIAAIGRPTTGSFAEAGKTVVARVADAWPDAGTPIRDSDPSHAVSDTDSSMSAVGRSRRNRVVLVAVAAAIVLGLVALAYGRTRRGERAVLEPGGPAEERGDAEGKETALPLVPANEAAAPELDRGHEGSTGGAPSSDEPAPVPDPDEPGLPGAPQGRTASPGSSGAGRSVREPSDASVVRRLRQKARSECAPVGTVTVRFQVMRDGTPRMVTTDPDTPCIAALVKAAAFSRRTEPVLKELEVKR